MTIADSRNSDGTQIADALPTIRMEEEGNPSVFEVVSLAFDSLAGNKLRSLLTMLGVIIGVTAVVALLSLGDGVNNMITKELQAMGTKTLLIYASWPPGVARESTAYPFLTMADVQTISALNLPVVGIVPHSSMRTRLTAPSADTEAYIVATAANYAGVRNLKFRQGTFFAEEDVRVAAPVIVLGAEVAKTLFGNGEVLGQMVRARGVALRVIGVAEMQGGLETDADTTTYVPITLAQQRLGIMRAANGSFVVNNIVVAAREDADLDLVQARIQTALRERHHLKPDGSRDDFRVNSMTQMIQQAQMILGALTLFLSSVAGISLLVGGIGIMNIMLVSVTERTKEIGLRKAVGARGSDIMFQFIVEAMVISATGGLIGLGLGSLIAFAVTNIGKLFDAPVTPGATLIALGFSMAIGLFFGIYPARRAARLNPIDALRFE